MLQTRGVCILKHIKNSLRVKISAYETKFSPTIFLLHWKDQLKSLNNFFDRIFVTALLFEILNFV